MPRTSLSASLLLLLLAGCASAPPPAPPEPSWEQKLGWMLRLEDRRVLRDEAPATPQPVPAGGRAQASPSPAAAPDLVRLLQDPEARVRRRAALAIGRVGLPDGVAPLTKTLAGDTEVEVRQMAAFALGLIGSRDAAAALRAALDDPSPIVRGRAAEALGLIGDAASAGAIGEMAAAYVRAGALATVVADELGYPLAPETEAVRLAIYALARLKAYEPLAALTLGADGAPVTRWWPVAYAFRRVEDTRAIPVLRTLADGDGMYTRAFATRGLGVLKDAESLERLRQLAARTPVSPAVGVEAVRALAAIGDARAYPTLLELLRDRSLSPDVRAEIVVAIGAMPDADSRDALYELLSDPSPAVRAEALIALATVDREGFLIALSGLEPDRHWTVRAARARALAHLPPATAAPLLEPMIEDEDQRVLPSVLGALASLKTPRAAAIALEKLRADDPVVRAAAASALAGLKPDGAVAALREAATFAQRDSTYVARAAALTALTAFGREAAEPALVAALEDKDWALRRRAAELLGTLDPQRETAHAIRPAPTRFDRSVYEDPSVVAPSVSTHVYIDTDKGTIQIELAVLDAPLTVRTFTDLARSGYFGGVPVHRVVPNFVIQDGDPRGDGEGGPGFTIRDELNQRPYLRGTVGMALDWADTGGSQFFITHSPQPHLDARYTVVGHVVSGMDVVDRISRGDLIRGVRVWDGTTAP